jgi:hypothetical protein
MQPRQLARVLPVRKISSVAKRIVGPKAPVIDCCIVTLFPWSARLALRGSGSA